MSKDRYIAAKQKWAEKQKAQGVRARATASRDRLPPGQKLTDGFPVLDLGVQPAIPSAEWRLKIDGAVARPADLSWEQFNALPPVDDVSDFHCVTTWSKYDCRWGGVAFTTLYELVQPLPEAKFVYFTSYDGYSTNVALEKCLDDDVLIATRFRGRLPRVHLDVFAPQQPPESIPLPMKCKTQRLAWCLLLLGILLPLVLSKITVGNWAPMDSIHFHVRKTMTEELPPVPLFNREAEFLPADYKDLTVTKFTAWGVEEGETFLKKRFREIPWLPAAIGGVFFILASLAWLFHKPRRKVLRHSLDLKGGTASESDAPGSTLEPI